MEATGRKHGIEHPMQMTVGMSDGERLWAVRYSSQHESRTLFVSEHADTLRKLHPDNPRLQQFTDEDRVVVSEPPGDLPGAWLAIPESTALIIQPGADEQRPFQPALAVDERGSRCPRTTQAFRRASTSRQPSAGAFDEAGGGWILFAGIMLMLVGLLNVIWGIAAVGNSSFFVHEHQVHPQQPEHLGLGDDHHRASSRCSRPTRSGPVTSSAAGSASRVAGLSAIGALMSIPAYPFWSLAIFAVDILVIYGLAAYGGQHRSL